MDINLGFFVQSFSLVATALVAGFFFAWTVSIVPGFAGVDDMAYLRSMQSINRAVLNPAFFTTFIGAALVLPLYVILQSSIGHDLRFWLILIAAAIYVLGTFGVTMFGNVPLNEHLESINLIAMNEYQLSEVRQVYEGPWKQLNTIRTIASIMSLICLVIAALIPLDTNV